MAAQNALDRPALADLAEARWRSGDLLGAGRAAQAHLDSGGDETMALVVMAETLGAQGRTADARAIALRVIERAGPEIDQLFCGQPRGQAWPVETVPGSAAAPVARGEQLAAWESAPRPAGSSLATSPPATRSPLSGDRRPVSAGGPTPTAPALERALSELAALEAALDAGAIEPLAARLAILVRTEPRLATRILMLAERSVALAGGHGGTAAALHLVRGDALRILGRESEAAAAYRQSGRSLSQPPPNEENA